MHPLFARLRQYTLFAAQNFNFYNLCLRFLMGITVVPREIKDNAYGKFGEQIIRCIIGDVQMANKTRHL